MIETSIYFYFKLDIPDASTRIEIGLQRYKIKEKFQITLPGFFAT